jgi:20S proteasome subunit alpha 7
MSSGAGYDLSVSTFSPDGRVYQVEYAAKAVENSGTVVGLCCKDGVVMGCEKFLTSKMLVPGTNRRILRVAKHAGIAMAGLVPDARQLALRARAEASQYEDSYKSPIPARILADRVGLFVHLFTIYWSVRPCGASVLLAIKDVDGTPSLYGVDSPGTVLKYYAHAVGKGARQAKGMIEKLDLKELTCAEAVKHVAHIIHKVHDEKDKEFELELSWLCPQSNNEQSFVPKEIMKEAEEYAKAQLAAAEEED